MKQFLKQFAQRDAHPMIQFIKYGLAGAVAVLTHVIIFQLFAIWIIPAKAAALGDAVRARHAMLDNFIAFLFSNSVAYIINIKWVFEPGRHARHIEIGLFFLVSAVSLFIGTSMMGVLIRIWGINTDVAFLSNIVSAALINYACRKFLIFKG